ncbi:mannosyl-oligosaccharide glucosidase GCS1-like protein [Carex littledalei]|uniref:Mannosyl-oligosaccharide glucosidase GCS1-like protein n=1 Tax=Carex littledalei TaxID=544730 RepID=A0A833QWZ8_9POAL|nr:mannosyl-oligosaccharide glucosidase GCS1-like protein [Carex littledalei]
MAGDNRTTTHRSRGRASPERTADDATREKSRRQGGRGPHHQRRSGVPIRWTFPVLGFISLLLIGSLVYYNWGFGEAEGELVKRAKRSVTPLAMPKLMDLPQFGGSHKDSLYWGTYRPHVYLGIRARTAIYCNSKPRIEKECMKHERIMHWLLLDFGQSGFACSFWNGVKE